MKYIGFILMFSFLLIGWSKVPEKYKSFDETMSVINEYTKKIKQEKNIRRSGYGLNYAGQDKIYDGKIHVINLSYRADKNMRYDEARAYFYTVVNGLLDHINKNTKLKKYFFHYPVDYSDLEFHFTFEDNKDGLLKKDEVQSIHIVRNEIFYEILNEDAPNEIEKDQVSPDIYIMKGILEGNRSIIRTVEEDLAMHEK